MPPNPPGQTINQGSPNTPANAWPVKVTDGNSTILGSSGNPFPVSGNVTVGNTDTNPIPMMNVKNTHVGQLPSNLVSLLTFTILTSEVPPEDAVISRITSDGMREEPFVIPTNKVLIVTDVTFSRETDLLLNIGNNQILIGGGRRSFISGIAISRHFFFTSSEGQGSVWLQGYLIDAS